MQRLYFAVWLSLICMCSLSHASISERFKTLQTRPNELYAFLKEMPKGGDLHYHYDGAVYAETMLHLGSNFKHLCIQASSLKSTYCRHKTSITAKEVLSQPAIYQNVIRAWSMQDFKSHTESAHDHFFSVFPKVGIIYSDLKSQLLAEILKKAASQNILYLEIIAFGLPTDDYYAKLIKSERDFSKKRAILIKNHEFLHDVQRIVKESQSFLKEAHKILHCDRLPDQSACKVKANFQFYVRRVKSLDAVYAQALAGFMAVNQSHNLVGINLVDIEDNPVAQQDYEAHMRIFGELHRLYPKVHIGLHAGELYPRKVAPHLVKAPIQDAIVVGHAERIGHGLDIQEEPHSETIVKMMAQKNIAVEINLTSNRLVFGVQGKAHPLHYYLQHQVPVVLSTDDEGILRTDLTNEYQDAIITHHLDYASIKQINRNALTYSFISGQSLWLDPQRAILVKECEDLSSASCLNFIHYHPKAQLQWQLEQALIRFEKKWS